MTDHEILAEMLFKQRSEVPDDYKLEENDMKRIIKNVDGNIFDENNCVLWQKFLTKCNSGKSCYVNFYIKGKKFALHRILYANFIDDLRSTQYLKHTCDNPGQCCNINHFYRIYEEEECVEEEENIVIGTFDSPNKARNKLITMFED